MIAVHCANSTECFDHSLKNTKKAIQMSGVIQSFFSTWCDRKNLNEKLQLRHICQS